MIDKVLAIAEELYGTEWFSSAFVTFLFIACIRFICSVVREMALSPTTPDPTKHYVSLEVGPSCAREYAVPKEESLPYNQN